MKQYRNIGQIVIFVLVLTLFVMVVHRFIIPVIVGSLVSLVFRPVYRWIMSRIGNRARIAAAISTLLVIIGVLLPLILIGSVVIKDVTNVARHINEVSAHANQHTGSILQSPFLGKIYDGIHSIYPLSPEEFDQRARSLLASAAAGGKDAVRTIAGSIPRAVTSLVFFLIAFYFGLVDGPRFVGFMEENSPFSVRETRQIIQIIHRICNAVVLGAFLAGIVQGIIMGLSYWILGIPKPVFFGALTALFGLIPLVGSAPCGIGGTIYLLAIGKPIKAIIMLAAFGLAGISDNIVKPLVLKGRTALHPFLGLISVLGGLKAFGVAGIFLGPVVMALTIVLLQLFHHRVKTLRERTTQAAAE
jgi:predicted PurR-regulated permease PerM